MQIKKIMSQPVVTLQGTDSVGDAIKLMKDKFFGSIVIVDEDNLPLNIFTEHDVMYGLDKDYKINPSMKLNQLPRKSQLITILESDSLDDAIKIFTDTAIHHLVVTDVEGFVTGMISTKDVIKAQTKLNKAFPYFPNTEMMTH